MLNNDEQQKLLLQQKPARQQGSRPAPLLFLLGGIVILGALLVVGWQVYTTHNASSSAGSNTEKGSGQDKGPTQAPWDTYPDVYWQTVRAQMAQGLHMSEQQIRDSLHSTLLANSSAGSKDANITSANAAQWLNDLASAHGVSQQQLHTIEVTAIQRAHTVLVDRHVLTRQQADENIRQLNQEDLNLHMVDAFSGGDHINVKSK